MKNSILAFITFSLSFFFCSDSNERNNLKLWEWEKGYAVESTEQEGMKMYFWFYEWNMFDAIQIGEHTNGSFDNNRNLNEDSTSAYISTENLKVEMNVVTNGVELLLTVTNSSQHSWPDIAAIIPCFNPGAPPHRMKNYPLANLNEQFNNTNTYFIGQSGLEKLVKRQIHFNEHLQHSLDKKSPTREFIFSSKWPTADPTKHGILIRESTDKQWVTGIAWENFLSVQGHNPWQCMHLGILVGPMEPGETKTVRGKIYLFRGLKEDCFERYVEDFEKH